MTYSSKFLLPCFWCNCLCGSAWQSFCSGAVNDRILSSYLECVCYISLWKEICLMKQFHVFLLMSRITLYRQNHNLSIHSFLMSFSLIFPVWGNKESNQHIINWISKRMRQYLYRHTLLFFFRFIPRNGMARSYGRCIFAFLRNYWMFNN